MNERQYEEWKSCPLDVETLAKHSVRSASKAAQMVADTRGIKCRISSDLAQIPFSFSSLENLKVDDTPTIGWGDLSGFFQASDGWVRLHGNYDHHATAIASTFKIKSKEELRKILPTISKYEIEESIIDRGGIASAVREVGEWQRHPQGIVAASTPWVELDLEPQSAEIYQTKNPSLPLEGIRVLDLTRVIAGPTCTQLLACLGAEVLRIDPPALPELRDQYISNGMGKKSAVVDLYIHKELIHKLLPKTHILVMGYTPRSLDKFGLSIEGLRHRYPNLLIASLSAWGDSGPWGSRAGFDSIVQAATGISELCSKSNPLEGGIPGALPVQALDHSTGFILAKYILESLAHHKSGVIKTSLLGAARALISMNNRQPSHDKFESFTHKNISLIHSPYGKLSMPSIPITFNGIYLQGKIVKYGSSLPMWSSLEVS